MLIMSTVNISLPEKQIDIIDDMTERFGFESRSEFIRSLIRFVAVRPDIIESAAIFPFAAPPEKSAEKIVSAFTKAGKYSDSFIKDLKEGLSESDYFTK